MKTILGVLILLLASACDRGPTDPGVGSIVCHQDNNHLKPDQPKKDAGSCGRGDLR